jgi:hypothetical protein
MIDPLFDIVKVVGRFLPNPTKSPFHLRTKGANSRGTTFIPPGLQAALQRDNGRIPKRAYLPTPRGIGFGALAHERPSAGMTSGGFQPVAHPSLSGVARLLLSIIAILMIEFIGDSLARTAGQRQ